MDASTVPNVPNVPPSPADNSKADTSASKLVMEQNADLLRLVKSLTRERERYPAVSPLAQFANVPSVGPMAQFTNMAGHCPPLAQFATAPAAHFTNAPSFTNMAGPSAREAALLAQLDNSNRELSRYQTREFGFQSYR